MDEGEGGPGRYLDVYRVLKVIYLNGCVCTQIQRNAIDVGGSRRIRNASDRVRIPLDVLLVMLSRSVMLYNVRG